MVKTLRLVILLFLIVCTASFAQNVKDEHAPHFIAKVSDFKIVPPFNQQKHISPKMGTEQYEIKNNRWLNFPVNFDAYPKGEDALRQKQKGDVPARMPIVNIDGATSGVDTGAFPPDPTGAVGPNHYIHSYNSGFIIYDKQGNVLQDHSSLGMIFPGQTDGDPIVLYDRYADRFIITEFATGSNGLLIAISQGPDPVNDGWYTYTYNLDAFPDYPKYSIWHDGYYVTANKQTGNYVYALERDKLLNGDTSAQIAGFTLPNIIANNNTVFAPIAMNSVGVNLPDASKPAYVAYLQDDAWNFVDDDHLKIWEIDMDWNNIGNSTVSNPTELLTTPFDSFTATFGSGEVPQPGTTQKLDGITGLISYNVNYLNFGSHNSVTLNFNVDVNSDDTILGIRWYELRETGGTWSIHQEGTYAPNDGLYRFMGSMCMDQNGNIGLAFSVGNETTPVSLRYTGRFAGSTLGEMVIAEETIVDGNGSQNVTNRYGDYAHLTLDPFDNQTFWFSSEYISDLNEWRTRITSFKIAPDEPNDVGVVTITDPSDATLTATESITVNIFNFGTDPQSNIPVWYQVDGGTVVNETFTGTVAPSSSESYTFTTTADMSTLGQTYTIVASTDLASDANTSNDSATKQVTHLTPNDIGVTSISTPQSGTGLTATETIEIVIENFGGMPQSNFDVSYNLDGNIQTEQVAGPINPGETLNYSFTATGDFSQFGIYSLSATTLLGTDSDTSNDAVSASIYHASCTPAAITGCNLDGIKRFVLGTIDVDTGENGCNTTGDVVGYADRTYLSTDLDRADGNNTHLLQSQHNWGGGATIEQLSVWIDFNDDGVFDASEQLIIAENYTIANALNDFDLVIPTNAALGTHILRARSIDPTGTPGDPNDPCADVQYGETQDYMVNIIDTSLSINDYALNDGEFIVRDLGDNNFEVSLTSVGFTDPLVITMHNILGQKMVRNQVFYDNGGYRYHLNLNGLSSGVYLIRLGTDKYGLVKRIVVK